MHHPMCSPLAMPLRRCQHRGARPGSHDYDSGRRDSDIPVIIVVEGPNLQDPLVISTKIAATQASVSESFSTLGSGQYYVVVFIANIRLPYDRSQSNSKVVDAWPRSSFIVARSPGSSRRMELGAGSSTPDRKNCRVVTGTVGAQAGGPPAD